MTGSFRFDCYPSDFLNGVIGLTGDEIAAYTIVMMLQYDRGAPVPYVGRERELQVRSGLAKAKLASAVDHLLHLGKLRLVDGALENGRTARELQKISQRISKNALNSKIGGEATKEKWDKIHNENNAKIEPGGLPVGQPKHSPFLPLPLPLPLERKNGGAESADLLSQIPDPDAELFRRGKSLLGASAGGQISKLKALFGGDVAKTRGFLEAAAAKENPAQYVAATIAKHGAKAPDGKPALKHGLYDPSL